MLLLLSYVFVLAGFAGLSICLALGLIKICDYIEEFPQSARRFGVVLNLAVLFATTVISFTDELPYTFQIASIVSAFTSYNVLKIPAWPAHISLSAMMFAFVTPLLTTASLLQYFRSLRARPVDLRNNWPGGRKDWDILDAQKQKYSTIEELTCLILNWLPSLWIALGATAESMDLPSSTAQARKSTRHS